MDTDIYEKNLHRILDRIPHTSGKSISCNRGWYKILIDTDEMLSFIDPDYKIEQVKEKFGTLRFYWTSEFDTNSVESKIMHSIVSQAEWLSSHTCEDCGKSKYGTFSNLDGTIKLQKSKGYVRTLCFRCASADGYNEVE